ncbi:unnamed protein product [Prorocentrum cordatum]|uniref:Uncharacterized protein n=1 Tax=Prorocentrum cordatum TaxID=2364126 RepID=A0ABN9SJW1_9DINO|nr:unnamed protein product [Polarella glacialis]
MHMEYEERPSGRRRRRRGRGEGGTRHDQIMVSEALLRLPIKLVDDGWKALRQHHPHQPHPPTRPSDASGWVASRLMESRPACVQHNTVLPKRLPTACASRCRVEPRSSCAPRDRIRLARGGDVHEEAEAPHRAQRRSSVRQEFDLQDPAPAHHPTSVLVRARGLTEPGCGPPSCGPACGRRLSPCACGPSRPRRTCVEDEKTA